MQRGDVDAGLAGHAVRLATSAAQVGHLVGQHREAGRGHLLTEDAVRMETVLALDAHGVGASRLAVEYLAPLLAGGKLDLVVDPPDGVVIELKYPRDSRSGISRETMTPSASCSGTSCGWPLSRAPSAGWSKSSTPGCSGSCRGAQSRHEPSWATREGESRVLHPAVLDGLPRTAQVDVGTARLPEFPTATCVVVESIDEG